VIVVAVMLQLQSLILQILTNKCGQCDDNCSCKGL